MKKKVLWFVCDCGKVKRMNEWKHLEMTVSVLVRKIVEQRITEIQFVVTKCDTCKKGLGGNP